MPLLRAYSLHHSCRGIQAPSKEQHHFQFKREVSSVLPASLHKERLAPSPPGALRCIQTLHGVCCKPWTPDNALYSTRALAKNCVLWCRSAIMAFIRIAVVFSCLLVGALAQTSVSSTPHTQQDTHVSVGMPDLSEAVLDSGHMCTSERRSKASALWGFPAAVLYCKMRSTECRTSHSPQNPLAAQKIS